MKKNNTLLFTKIVYSLFLIWTIIICIIIYNNIDNNITLKLVIGYALFVLFMLLYVPIITLFNARKLKWDYLKKVLNEFIFFFTIIFAFNCMFEYLFNHSDIDILDECFDALSLSFGVAFIDVTFLKKGKELE